MAASGDKAAEARAWGEVRGFVATRRLAVTSTAGIEGLQRRLAVDATRFAADFAPRFILGMLFSMPADRAARDAGEAFAAVAEVRGEDADVAALADALESTASARGATSKTGCARIEAALRCAEASASWIASRWLPEGSETDTGSASSSVARILEAACGLVGAEEPAVAIAAGDVIVAVLAALSDAEAAATPSTTSSASAAIPAAASEGGLELPRFSAVVGATRAALARSTGTGSDGSVEAARATEVLCRTAGCHPAALLAVVRPIPGGAPPAVSADSLSGAALDADPMAGLVFMSSLHFLCGTAAGAAWLRRTGILGRLEQLAGWPASPAVGGVTLATAPAAPVLETALATVLPEAPASEGASSAQAAPSAEAGIAVTEPDAVCSEAAAQALASIYARVMRLRFHEGPAGVGAKEEAARLREFRVGSAAVVAAMAAMDGLGSPSEGEQAHSAAIAAMVMAADPELLRVVLSSRDSADGGATPLERALARARRTAIVETFSSSTDILRRSGRLAMSQVFRAASVPPPAEVRGHGALGAAGWALGSRDLPEHLRGMPKEEAVARDAAAAEAASHVVGGGSTGGDGGSKAAMGGAGTGGSSSAEVSATADGSSAADATPVHEALWGALGGASAAAALLRSVKSAVWEDREAALAVCEALAGQPSGWGLLALRSAAGLPEVVISHDASDEPAANDVRRAVAEAAARCPRLDAAFGPELAARVRRVVSFGAPLTTTADPLVATDATY